MSGKGYLQGLFPTVAHVEGWCGELVRQHDLYGESLLHSEIFSRAARHAIADTAGSCAPSLGRRYTRACDVADSHTSPTCVSRPAPRKRPDSTRTSKSNTDKTPAFKLASLAPLFDDFGDRKVATSACCEPLGGPVANLLLGLPLDRCSTSIEEGVFRRCPCRANGFHANIATIDGVTVSATIATPSTLAYTTNLCGIPSGTNGI
jgi:hypothetical protein